MRDVAIQVEHVSKDFVLPHEKIMSIKSLFLSFYRLRRTKATQHALRGVSFEVKDGEFFGLVGRNGSGKSTMLKMLAGIYQPTKGKIHINGKLVPFIELGVGFNPELSGRENVYLNSAIFGFTTTETDAMYEDIVTFAELEDFMDQKLKNYSSGMQVRLAFAVAVKANADILLVDEVLAVGDAAFQRKCYEYFKQLKKNKKTVVFVSHDMDIVREYCDRAALINEGEVVYLGSADEAAQRYLRLFNHGAGADKVSTKTERWGNGWAKYETIECQVSGQSISITAGVHAAQDVDNVIYGFRIRDGIGREILGTNSWILGHRTLDLKAGQKAIVSWEFPNILSGGVYSLDPALLVGDGATVCDWWNDARQIEIVKEVSTTYPVTPDIAFKVAET